MTNFLGGGLMPMPPMKGAAGAAKDGAAAAAGASRGGSGGAGGGGGYEFTPEEVAAVLQQWEDLYAEPTLALVEAERIAGVLPPGNEPASATFVKAANPAGHALRAQTEAMAQHVKQYVEALRQAKEAIQASEDQALQNVGNAGSGVS